MIRCHICLKSWYVGLRVAEAASVLQESPRNGFEMIQVHRGQDKVSSTRHHPFPISFSSSPHGGPHLPALAALVTAALPDPGAPAWDKGAHGAPATARPPPPFAQGQRSGLPVLRLPRHTAGRSFSRVSRALPSLRSMCLPGLRETGHEAMTDPPSPIETCLTIHT